MFKAKKLVVRPEITARERPGFKKKRKPNNDYRFRCPPITVSILQFHVFFPEKKFSFQVVSPAENNGVMGRLRVGVVMVDPCILTDTVTLKI